LKAWKCLEADVQGYLSKKTAARARFYAKLEDIDGEHGNSKTDPPRMESALHIMNAMQSEPVECEPFDPKLLLNDDPLGSCVRMFPAYAVSAWREQLHQVVAQFEVELEQIRHLEGALPRMEPGREDFIRLGMRAAEEAENIEERLKWLRFVDFVARDRKALASFWEE